MWKIEFVLSTLWKISPSTLKVLLDHFLLSTLCMDFFMHIVEHNSYTFSFVEDFKPFFQGRGKYTLWFLQCGKFKLYFPHGGKYHKVLSILWKLSAFLPQNSFDYLIVEVLVPCFLLVTLCMIFFIQLFFLHIVDTISVSCTKFF